VTITNDLLSDPFTSVEGRYIHRVTTLISVCFSLKYLVWL